MYTTLPAPPGPGPRTARLDHLCVVAPTLEVGAAYVEAALGLRLGAGRAHPGMATHNLLLALGPTFYLEVIAPDPLAAPVPRRRRFGLDRLLPNSPPHLAPWVASADDIARTTVAESGLMAGSPRAAVAAGRACAAQNSQAALMASCALCKPDPTS